MPSTGPASRSSRNGSRRAGVLVLAFLAVPCARAGTELSVSGEVVARVPRLEVRLVIENRGDTAAVPLDVVGELLGERREARIVKGIAPGEEAAVVLDFAAEDARAGLHALTLLLEHPAGGAPDAAGNPPVKSQRAYLLLAVGPNPGPAVSIDIECPQADAGPDCATPIGVRGVVTARLESTDSEAHRMKVTALTARGLRPEGPPITVEVPAAGTVSVRIPMIRAGALPGSRHGVLVVAETIDDPLARTSVQTATVEVAAHPSLVRRLRWPLLALGLALLATTAVAEWRRRYQA
jgi:hypothetical protein